MQPWAAKPRVGGGGGVPPYRQPALQPNSYGAAGMWALQATGNTLAFGTDRSGNARNLSDAFGYCCPDIMKNRYVAMVSNDAGARVNGWQAGVPASTALKMAAFTVTARVAAPFYISGGGGSAIVGAQAAGTNAEWVFGRVNDATSYLYSYWQHGGFVAVQYTTTLAVADNKWHFVSYRRTAGYVVTIGMDGVYQTSGALTPPDATGASPTFACGNQGGTGFSPWNGLMADVCFWPSVLTDAQINALQVVAMGGYPP